VLGAGGSARAVVYVLARAGYQVWIAARRSEQAQELAISIENGLQTGSTVSTAVRWQRASLTESSASIQGIPLTPVALRQLPERVALIVNTTPLGMAPHSGVSAWPDEIPLPPDACVYDLVYNPPETPLIHLARKSGLPVCGGLGMLVEQAALAFERWTGQPASRSDMLAAVAELQLLENSS
jgi:shikimate dehydrogenase